MAWTQIANDTFTGSGTIAAHTPDSGGSYTVIGSSSDFLLSGTGVTYLNAGGATYALHSVSANAKQAVQIDTWSRNGYPTVCLLMNISSGNATGYAVYVDAGFGSVLAKFTGSGSAISTIATDTTVFSDNGHGHADTLRVEYEPATDTFSIYRDTGSGFGSPLWTYADSTYTSGGVGFGQRGLGDAGDNWIAYEDTSGGAAGKPWYAYAQQRTRTLRSWDRHGLIWTPSYAF